MYTLIANVKILYEDRIYSYFKNDCSLSANKCIEDYKKSLIALYELKDLEERLSSGRLGVENGDK
jgi:hypothetical protein